MTRHLSCALTVYHLEQTWLARAACTTVFHVQMFTLVPRAPHSWVRKYADPPSYGILTQLHDSRDCSTYCLSSGYSVLSSLGFLMVQRYETCLPSTTTRSDVVCEIRVPSKSVQCDMGNWLYIYSAAVCPISLRRPRCYSYSHFSTLT